MPGPSVRRLLPCLLLAVVSAAAQTQSVSFFGNVVTKKGDPVSQPDTSDLPSLLFGKTASTNLKVTPASEIPLLLGVLMDMSKSEGNANFLAETGNAALHLMNQVVRRGKDSAFLAGFSLQVSYSSGLTDDRQEWLRTAQGMRTGGPTALYDAVALVCRKELRPELERDSVRRILLIVSDGGDNQSRINSDAAVAAAQEKGVTIFVVDPKADREDLDWSRLKKLAEETGGRAISLSRQSDIAPAFSKILDDINAQQLVTADVAGSVTGNNQLIEIRAQGKSTLRWRVAKKLVVAPAAANSQ